MTFDFRDSGIEKKYFLTLASIALVLNETSGRGRI